MKTETKDNIMAFACGVLLFCCILLSMEAEAGDKHKKPTTNINNSQRTNTATSEAASESVSQSDASSDNSVEIGGDIYDIPVSTAYAPQAYSHIRCDQILGFGATKDDGSVAVGIPMPRWMSRKIKDCQRVDGASWLASIGLQIEAIKLRCETKVLVEQYGDTQACIDTLSDGIGNVKTIENLKQKLEIVSKERAIEKRKCDESKDRITEAWKSSCSK